MENKPVKPVLKSLGRQFALKLAKKGLTHADVEVKAKLGARNFGKYLKGDQNMALGTLMDICEAMDCTFEIKIREKKNKAQGIKFETVNPDSIGIPAYSKLIQ